MVIICFLILGFDVEGKSSEAVSREEVDAVVAKLVSPNQRPEIKHIDAKYPPGYEKGAQRVVHEAYSAINRFGPPAFPTSFHTSTTNATR